MTRPGLFCLLEVARAVCCISSESSFSAVPRQWWLRRRQRRAGCKSVEMDVMSLARGPRTSDGSHVRAASGMLLKDQWRRAEGQCGILNQSDSSLRGDGRPSANKIAACCCMGDLTSGRVTSRIAS